MAHKYLSRIKKAVHAGIWEHLCSKWFVRNDDSKTLKFDVRYIIKKFTADIEKENSLSINQSNIIYFTVHKCLPKNLQDNVGNKVKFLK